MQYIEGCSLAAVLAELRQARAKDAAPPAPRRMPPPKSPTLSPPRWPGHCGRAAPARRRARTSPNPSTPLR
jgi:hypothetical protein